MKDRFLTGALVYVIYASFALIALRVLIIRPGVIGMRNDWGIPPYSEQLSGMLTDPLYVWYSEDLGHPIFLQSGAIIGGLFGIFGCLGMEGELFSKLLVLLLFPFIGFNMYLLFHKLSKTFLSQFIAGLFYEFNPFVYNLFSSGFNLALVAYALSPLVILMFIKAVKKDHLSHRYALIATSLFVLVGAVLQYAVMVFILLLAFSLLRLNRKNRRGIIKFLFLIGAVWLALNVWWILPFYEMRGHQEKVISIIAPSIFTYQIAPISSILDVARLAGPPNFFIPGLLLSPAPFLAFFHLTSIVIVLIAFSTLLFRKDRITLIFAFIAGVTPLFISSGAFAWLYESFFLARLFRNFHHLYFLIVFSYSALLGLASESYHASIGGSKRLSSIYFNFPLKKAKKIANKRIGTMLGIIILLLINSSPFFMENISNTVHNFNLPSDYKNIYDWLSQQSGQFRVIWQPDVTPIIYKPAVEGLSNFYSGGGVDAYIGYSPKPAYGNYLPSDFSQFIEVSLHQAPTEDLAYLLSSISVKYIIVRQDYETLAPAWGYMDRYPELQEQWSNEYVINKLTDQKAIVFYERIGNATVLENKLVTPWVRSVTPENVFVILGDANAFFVLPTLPNFPVNNSMLIFSSQYSSEEQLPPFRSNIVILNYDAFDLVQAYIPSRYKIEPGLYAGGIDADTDWVSTSRNQIYTWWWYNWRYTANVEATALTLTNANLTIPYNVAETDTYDLWGKVFFGPKSSALTIYIDGKEETTINLSITERDGFFWEHLTRLNLTQGRHTVTINSNKGENVIAKIVIAPQHVLDSAIKNATSFLDNRTIFLVDQNWNSNLLSVPNSSINIFRNILEKVQNARIIYLLNYPPQISARYYSGWKGVISTNGQGDPEMLIFPSPDECPYIDAFPSFSPGGWSAYNSTLIYITTGSSQLTINSVLADGTQASATAWWQTDTSWRTDWPITIPSNQRAMIQVNQRTSTITLETDSDAITLLVYDEWTNPPPIKAPSETSTDIYIPKAGNYLLAIKVATGYAYGNLSTKIDDQGFIIDADSQEQGPVFTYKYIGPIKLTAGYHQISTSGARTEVTTLQLYSLKNGESFIDADDILNFNETEETLTTYEKTNPTKYIVHVNASKPFFLVFSESYHKDWVAYVDGQQIADEYHFMANGYANAWYINKTGTYNVTLEFWPQKLFYIGSAISITTLILCILYISKNKIKTIFKRYIKKNKNQTSQTHAVKHRQKTTHSGNNIW